MATSLGFTDASRRHSDVSSTSQTSYDVRDDAFGSFTTAERLSDPFGDVYGAEADFGAFEGSSGGHAPALAPSVDVENSSLLLFSPRMAPAVASRCEIDPFADIVGTDGTGKEEDATMEKSGAFEGDFIAERVAAAPTAKASATLEILDLVWGNTHQEA